MVARSQADQSNEHLRSAQKGSRKLADADNTKMKTALFISTRIRPSTKLEVLDNSDHGMALKDEFGVLDQDILCQFCKFRKFDFMLQILSPSHCSHDHLQGHQRCCERVLIISVEIQVQCYVVFRDVENPVLATTNSNLSVCQFKFVI